MSGIFFSLSKTKLSNVLVETKLVVVKTVARITLYLKDFQIQIIIKAV